MKQKLPPKGVFSTHYLKVPIFGVSNTVIKRKIEKIFGRVSIYEWYVVNANHFVDLLLCGVLFPNLSTSVFVKFKRI